MSIVFVESICDDPKVLSRNYEMKLQNARARRPHRVARVCVSTAIAGVARDAIAARLRPRRAATAVPRRPTTKGRTRRRPWLILWNA